MKILILGTRGVPAQHGGFETFAESLSLYLTERGHEVTVYCQSSTPPPAREDVWRGIRRVHIEAPVGPWGTIRFDWRAMVDALRRPGLPLILGYNTAVFSALLRLQRRPSLMNMDGLEWKRDKWSRLERLWLRFNEFAGARLSTHLIADHPEIGEHLQQYVPAGKITVIAYGADAIAGPCPSPSTWAHTKERLGIGDRPYSLVVARMEPENSILDIVRAFSSHPRDHQLVVLGNIFPTTNAYHRAIVQAAGAEVLFAGAIYDKETVANLRLHACIYFHGHGVGGTNPSLVEAMAAGSAIVAHDNIFTRWVAGQGARYFTTSQDLALLLDELLDDELALVQLRLANRTRHQAEFTQETILAAYTALLQRFSSPGAQPASALPPPVMP